jgi:hypothetical protein
MRFHCPEPVSQYFDRKHLMQVHTICTGIGCDNHVLVCAPRIFNNN